MAGCTPRNCAWCCRWFDSELFDGIGFSNHPAAPELIYGIGFFPFSQPVAVDEGDRIELRLAADLVKMVMFGGGTQIFSLGIE